MTTSLESLQLYTKILTGMVLLLNISLLLSIRMALKYARISCAAEGASEEGGKRWSTVKRGLAVLILTVVCVNGAAVFANHRLIHATREIASQVPQDLDTELALSMLTQPQTPVTPITPASASK